MEAWGLFVLILCFASFGPVCAVVAAEYRKFALRVYGDVGSDGGCRAWDIGVWLL